ncbi:uncharacterized protein LOC123513395 [Portunus trituberculatus]|uniref:uncharacterized protein LOC123513395 n=1 Tax=Portunus trituberculatus TaxID=210409 RepID=UPI001E1CFAFE|nr:uncharacterized protein LOC123513395 [Portunus trituberculatus]
MRCEGKMARIHCKITPLSVYLVVLATYSTLMMLACLENEQLERMAKEHEQETAAPLEEDMTIVRDRRSQHGRWLRSVDDFFRRMGTLETTCSKMVSLGGTYCRRALDNNKVVCLDEDVTLKSNNCTVYSFGIGADTTFDDQMNYYGCDVFMFDPTVNPEAIVSTNLEHERFHLLGLDIYRYNRTHLNVYPDGINENITGEFDTYDNIRRRLGHESRPVHYLKMDIENSEWRVLPDLAKGGKLEGVRQLAIEIHTMDIIRAPTHQVLPLLRHYWQVLEHLTRLGFLRAWYRPNLVVETMYHVPGENRSIATCFEVLYLRRGPVY